jgi:hypothetical protein
VTRPRLDDNEGESPDALVTLSAVQIRWYGQSAFLLTASDGPRVFIDPFGEISEEMLAVRRERMPDFRFDYAPIADVEADLLHTIRATAGTLSSPLGEIVAVASEHDELAGTQPGRTRSSCSH